MNFKLSEEQQAFREMARAFARERLLPHAATWDDEHVFPVDALRAAAAQGLAGIYVRLAEDDGSYTTGNIYGAGGGQGQP